MNVRLTELSDKQVINIKDGCCIGYVNDVEVDTCSAQLCAIVVFGQPKYMGLFGRSEDTVIPWCNIKVIGEDTILVDGCKICCDKPKGKHLAERLFED